MADQPKLKPLDGPASDPFDLTNLRLDQSFVESAGVKRLLTTVPVRKPNPQDFVRVHPDPAYRATLAIIELKDDREIYLVPPSIAVDLPGEYAMTTIYTAINRQGVTFLWPGATASTGRPRQRMESLGGGRGGICDASLGPRQSQPLARRL